MTDIRAGQIVFVDLTTSLSASDLATSLTYASLYSSTAYTDLSITNAYLDPNFRIFALTDSFSFADFITYTIFKSLSLADSFITLDTITSFDVGKVLDDPVFFADAIVVIYDAFRTFTETVTATDLAALLTVRSASENLTLSDASAIETIFTFSESVSYTDGTVFGFSPVFSDTLVMGDSIFTLIGFNFSLAETLTMGDTILSMPSNSIESSVPNVSTIGTYMINY